MYHYFLLMMSKHVRNHVTNTITIYLYSTIITSVDQCAFQKIINVDDFYYVPCAIFLFAKMQLNNVYYFIAYFQCIIDYSIQY